MGNEAELKHEMDEGSADAYAAGDGDRELGDETLDLASVPDPPSISLESILWPSSFARVSNCLVIPNKTSAISISISSWHKDADLENCGQCFASFVGF